MRTTKEDMNNWLGNFPSKSFADGTCYLIGAFANVGVVKTTEGLLIFDLALKQYHRRIHKAIREFSDKQMKYIVYSHGHFDHCFGFSSLLEEIKVKGWDLPEVIAHENVLKRFEKYRLLEKYHAWLNKIQFGSSGAKNFPPVSAQETLNPSIILHGNEMYKLKFGEYSFEIHHDLGETDDSLWMYFKEKKVLFTGDLVMNPSFPNVGNPNKVQRYPKQWAIAMEKMLEKKAEYLLPGHGKLVVGKENVKEMLSIRAEVMHFVHDEVVKRMNEGKWFEQIFHEMLEIYPSKFKYHKFLKPSYGCYRFAIHAVYRLYHGWYDSGNPTDLFPAKTKDIAKEFLKINDDIKYYEHAKSLYSQNKLQLALHILDIVIKGCNLKKKKVLLDAYSLKSTILTQKAKEEPSFIVKNSLLNGIQNLKTKIKELND